MFEKGNHMQTSILSFVMALTLALGASACEVQSAQAPARAPTPAAQPAPQAAPPAAAPSEPLQQQKGLQQKRGGVADDSV